MQSLEIFSNTMESSDLVQEMETLKQLLQDTQELCTNKTDHLVEEQNERAWHGAEKEARWNEMYGKVEKIKADIQNCDRQETERNIDASTLLGVLRQNHRDRLDAIANALQDSKSHSKRQQEELVAATRAMRKTPR